MRRPLTALLPVFLFAGVVALAACGQAETQTTAPATLGDTVSTVTTAVPRGETTAITGEQLTSTWQRFTSEELAQFDGKGGRPAYVAVDGVVYDVSDSSRWPEGVHNPCNLGAMAGQDLSDLLTRAPARMRTLLEKMPVVGALD